MRRNQGMSRIPAQWKVQRDEYRRFTVRQVFDEVETVHMDDVNRIVVQNAFQQPLEFLLRFTFCSFVQHSSRDLRRNQKTVTAGTCGREDKRSMSLPDQRRIKK